MQNKFKTDLHELKYFLILWVTQSFSQLGSGATNFALVLWSYQQQGSALSTALLTVCSYAPYVLLSIFAGALSDRWDKKRTMLVSDSCAALSTVCILLLLLRGELQIWHLYVANTLNGLMNTVQQPASDVAVSLLCPPRQYQRVGGLRSLSNALVTMLTPMIASAIFAFSGLYAVILFDLSTFLIAFFALLLGVRLPQNAPGPEEPQQSVLASAADGLRYLRRHRGLLDLILFLSVINLTASIYNAALPAMVLSRADGGTAALGLVNTATGLATLLGSLLATLLPAPQSRVRVILNCLLFSMSTENFLLAFGRSAPVWCLGAVLGWLFIPLMNTNMDVLLRSAIPIPMQGRVYAVRNTLQFCTIPLGYLCGGLLVDRVCEPFMAAQPTDSLWTALFGMEKGAGAALLFAAIGLFGALSCLPIRADRHIWRLEHAPEASGDSSEPL